MRRKQTTSRNSGESNRYSAGKSNSESSDSRRVASSPALTLLAPEFGQALPSLAGILTDYTYETNLGTLIELCRVLVERGIGNKEIWAKTGQNPLRFAASAIQYSIKQSCGDLLERNVDYQLSITDTLDGYGHPRFREGELLLSVECHGCGYLLIGPALDALETEAPGLGASFYHLLRRSLYRWMCIYDHVDAEAYSETLHEWAEQDAEDNQQEYEFPDVEGSIPAFLREKDTPKEYKYLKQLRLHQHGHYGSWIKRLLQIHRLCRFRCSLPRQLFEDAWDSPPLPALLISFREHDAIEACFEAEAQSMYETSHEPLFCFPFSIKDPTKVDQAIRRLRTFLAINVELFRLIEGLDQHRKGQVHETTNLDRQQPEFRAA